MNKYQEAERDQADYMGKAQRQSIANGPTYGTASGSLNQSAALRSPSVFERLTMQILEETYRISTKNAQLSSLADQLFGVLPDCGMDGPEHRSPESALDRVHAALSALTAQNDRLSHIIERLMPLGDSE